MVKSHPDQPRRRNTQLRIGRTRVGKGVFAQRPYRMGDLVGEIRGEIITDEGYGSEYCIDLEDGRTLEPAAPFRFVNHSCEPNCEFDFYDLAEPTQTRRRVFVSALRDIATGEQLTFDYNWAPPGTVPCRCKASTCRGWIVAKSEPATIETRSSNQDT